ESGHFPQSLLGRDRPRGDGMKKAAEVIAKVVACQREGDDRPQVSGLGSAVEALALKAQGMHAGAGDFRCDGVRQLNLAAGAGRLYRQSAQNAWAQYVAADDGEVRWRVCRIWLLDH